MAAQPNALLTEEEYLAMERESEIKHEYYRGEIVAMVGASENHNDILTATISHLFLKLRGGLCRPSANDFRVRVSATGLYTYPDIVVICGPRQFIDDRRDTVLNPAAIIEILSPSTEAYDRGRKFLQYRTIPTLRDYLLIAQDVPRIEHYARQDDGTWRYAVADGLNATLSLPTLNCELTLAGVYELVDWDEG